MEDDKGRRDVVDPEVRAYIYSLVSALGGTGTDEDGRYVLGDDALACLKDIKRWLKLYDEKTNRLDVARCLAEANLVKGDLLEILAAWPEDATEDRVSSKIALACLELLVPLTWPIEKSELNTTLNHHRHIPYLQLAQITYKREVLEHESSAILRTAVRTALPSIALPPAERTLRDEGIIKLLLYFFRNLVIISPQQNRLVEWNEQEVSRSATIEAFDKQDVLPLLLTLASNIGEEFKEQDVVLLEILFHLVKGVDIEKLFMNEVQLEVKKTQDLKGLMGKEAAMHRDYAKNAPTRHNRFGTMIWVKRDDDRVSSVSGQEILSSNQNTLSKMDKSKRWRRPKYHSKKEEEATANKFDLPVPLSTPATQKLRSFVEEFLDTGFNPLCSYVRKAIEREEERVLDIHSQQYFYIISWFLEAERMRRQSQKELDKNKSDASGEDVEPDSFGLVASVLNQETFVLLNRFMQGAMEHKEWQETNAGMRCFTQILLTVQEMSESPLEEDQEIAENIQNRIFYEETTHDRIMELLRTYKDQGFGYLDAVTELSHVFLRMLERYSKENVDLQVRSRRRARNKKKDKASGDAAAPEYDGDDSEAEDRAEAQRVSKERKFDFKRISRKLLKQGCVDTFVTFTTFYRDLNSEQLKRAHRFFYRVAFKQEMSVLLFRIDIIALFNKIIKGPEGLDPSSPAFKEWDELVRQLIRRLVKKLQQRPELAIELLFSKINPTLFYLEHGYEKQTIISKPKAPAELVIKGDLTPDEQIGVAVAVLVGEKMDAIDFVENVLKSAISERRSWEAATEAHKLLNQESEGQDSNNATETFTPPSILVNPDNDGRKHAMFKDNKLRLLMTLAGFERVGTEDDPEATWIVPSSLTTIVLQETYDLIEKHRSDPKIQYGSEDNPKSAEDMLQRKSAIRRRVEYDDDSEGDGSVDDEFLFAKGGPTARKSDALEELKKRRRRRQLPDTGSADDSEDDERKKARRKARALAELEKMRKIKSNLMVHSSDEDEDEDRDREFFAREEELRKSHSLKVLEAIKTGDNTNLGKSGTKRKSAELDETVSKKARKSSTDSDSESDRLPSVTDSSAEKARQSSPNFDANSDNEADAGHLPSVTDGKSSSPPASRLDTTDDEASSATPLSSPQRPPLRVIAGNQKQVIGLGEDMFKNRTEEEENGIEEDDDGDLLPSMQKNTRRVRGRAAVLDDSDED